tara:strand:- start:117 stop:395 length:279 start_codon:yes stop_codon:yes gene_type:complete
MDIDLENVQWDLDKIPEFGKGKEFAKEQLYYLKAKILKLQEVPDNIRLELTNDIYKIEQALNIDNVSKCPDCGSEDLDTEDKWCNKCGDYYE